jgi:DNA-binding MarR family transcriptional regulator
VRAGAGRGVGANAGVGANVDAGEGRAAGARDLDRAWQIVVGLVMDSRGDWRRKVADATGLPFTRFRALRRLADSPLMLSELAYEMGSDAPAATVIVNDLEKKGLVRRRSHPDDRRAKIVSLTAAGKRALSVARSVTDRAPDALAALPPQDVADLLRILEPLARR